jgi:hypothetical protein
MFTHAKITTVLRRTLRSQCATKRQRAPSILRAMRAEMTSFSRAGNSPIDCVFPLAVNFKARQSPAKLENHQPARKKAKLPNCQ